MELILVVSHGNLWEIKAVFGTCRLVTAASKSRKNKTRQVHVIIQHQCHTFLWSPEFLSVELSYVKEYLKTRIVLKICIFEVTVTPKIIGKLEKVMEKVVISQGICRSQNSMHPVVRVI